MRSFCLERQPHGKSQEQYGVESAQNWELAGFHLSPSFATHRLCDPEPRDSVSPSI